MRANGYKQKARQTAVVVPDGGVDLTGLPTDVSPHRAAEASNFILRRGANQKRFGWRQVSRICVGKEEPQAGEDPYLHPRINGMWEYKADGYDGMIVHAGDGLFYASVLEDGDMLLHQIRAGLADRRTQAFVQDGALYLVGGGAYIVVFVEGGVPKARDVFRWSGAYVPCTTRGIADEANPDDIQRISDEPVNLLTPRRVNRMIGRSTVGETYMTFRLDGEVDLSDEVVVMIATAGEDDEYGVPTVEERVLKSGRGGGNLFRVLPDGDLDEFPAGFVEGDKLMLSFDGGAIGGGMADFEPPAGAADNIRVEFSARFESLGAIGAERFGAFFGEDGTSWRLFLSGNPDEPEMIRFSGASPMKPVDLTYFPDVNYIRCGSGNRAITGMSRVSDGVLAVFKEPGGGEPTVYYVAGEGVRDAEKLTYTGVFRVTAGNVGDGIASGWASGDLYGDPLVLTRRGVFAVVLRQNVAVADRYLVERSRSISGRLAQEDLSDAVAIVHDGRYWLYAGGRVYVAEADRTYSAAGAESYQYEWWVLDNVPVRVFCEMGGKLLFGTEDGRICTFRDGNGAHAYEDGVTDAFYYGEALVTAGRLEAVSERLRGILGDWTGKRLVFSHGAFEEIVGADAFLAEAGRLRLKNPDEVFKLREGQVLEADFPDGLPEGYVPCLAQRQRVTVTAIDRGYGTFALLDEEGQPVDAYGGGFRLLEEIVGQELHVQPAEDGTYNVYREGSWDAPIILTEPRSPVPVELYGEVRTYQPVVAEWYTGVMDLGTNLYAKTLLGLTVAQDPGAGGSFRFGYETVRAAEMRGVRSAGGFSYGDVDFNDFSLSSMATSFTRRMNVRNINYIQFRFRSDEARNACVLNWTVYYKINEMNRGGR